MSGPNGFADDRLEPARRAAAVGALVLVAAALVVAAVGLQGDVGRVILAPLLLLLVTATAWVAATRKGTIRVAATVVAVVLVALTGFGQAHDRARALTAGFDSHLTKPADVAALHGALAHVCPRRGR